MTTREYVMRRTVLKRLKRARGVQTLICHHSNCDKPIEVGQEVISKSVSCPKIAGRMNVYHRQCYLDSFIDL